MEQGKRQKQIGGLIQEELNIIFQKLRLSFIEGGMVSITSVLITPDLLEARIYVSIFNTSDKSLTLKKIEDSAWDIKKQMAAKLKNQLRRIPELNFYLDETLDQVFKMEELFRKINKDENAPNPPKKLND
ncbi:MAG: 30S ribosome-binding factor RbfA [Flavisolibacter sp.]